MAALALVKPAETFEVAVKETNKVFSIVADGRRVGIAVAPDEHAAFSGAVRLLTRSIRGEEESGYRMISVKLL